MLHLIDTRQGTASQREFSHGNTLPITNVPFGMNSYIPQTHSGDPWFFHPSHRVVQGIRISHQPSPWVGDFAHFLLMPVAGGKIGGSPVEWASSYRPEEAEFRPHYLRMDLLRYQIRAELAPCDRGANLKLTYAGVGEPGLLIYGFGPGELHIDPRNRRITGSVRAFESCEDPTFTGWFALECDCDIDWQNSGFYENGVMPGGRDVLTDGRPFVVRFSGVRDCVELRLATSFINGEQAVRNLRDNPETFAAALPAARGRWEELLGRIRVSGRNEEHIRTFYTCLYRMFCFPQRFYERDEADRPIHYDTLSRTVKPGVLYTNNGFWDTYKTVYPLFSLIAPDIYAEMLEGFLNSYRDSGFLPKWLSPDERGYMPGTLIDAVIADAVQKGIGQPLWEELLEAMLVGATQTSERPGYGRQGMADYLRYGYVPCDKHKESVNHTLDYAYSDYCIAVVADKLGRGELAEEYRERSRNYRHLFDPETGFMRGKQADGSFRKEFSSIHWGGDYTEGSAWQNSFAVYHDIDGLIDLYGSKEAFERKLTDLCNTPPVFEVGGYPHEIHEMSEMAAVDFGQLAMSNQPSFHIPYLFALAGRPSTTQLLIKQILTTLFDSGWEGYPGDEDNGSMAGWYVFSAMGFYPVCPGSGRYVIGIPLFDKVEIVLPNGKTSVITAGNNTPQALFVDGVYSGNERYDKGYLEHSDLMDGMNLHLALNIVPRFYR